MQMAALTPTGLDSGKISKQNKDSIVININNQSHTRSQWRQKNSKIY